MPGWFPHRSELTVPAHNPQLQPQTGKSLTDVIPEQQENNDKSLAPVKLLLKPFLSEGLLINQDKV